MSESGTLLVRVYASQAEIPVKGATVVVTAAGRRGKQRLLSVQITDSSGKVKPIPISAPDRAESEVCGLPDGTAPFAVCDVWAEHPGYAMLRIKGVQIFSGIETVQNIELIPLGVGESSLQHLDVRDIPAQSL